jgi:uncharacterized protein YjbI with pentapeptide repeats
MSDDLKNKIEELIQSVNTAAGHARTLIASLLFIALTMSALVVGTTDEAMLRDSINAVPMLGVQISVSLLHLFAPIVLLFLHIGALIQLDLLDARRSRLQQSLLDTSIIQSVRSHYGARIDGMADAYSFAKDDGDVNPSHLRSLMAWLSIVWIPPLVLLAVQINFVRFQHDVITSVQAAALVLDGLALVHFFGRLRKRRNQTPVFDARNVLIRISMALFIVVSFNARPPSENEVVRNVRWTESDTYSRYYEKDTTPRQWDNAFPDATCPRDDRDTEPTMGDVYGRPLIEWCNLLDAYLCPHTGWGCRYLDLSNRTQVAGAISSDLIEAIAVNSRQLKRVQNPNLNCGVLRISDPDLVLPWGTAVNDPEPPDVAPLPTSDIRLQRDKDLESMDGTLKREFQIGTHGLKLRDRSLRFANFKDAVLVGSDLINADLRGANFEETYLVQAWMDGADLSGAMLDDAFLEAVHLEGAVLKNVSLREAHLQRAELEGADLSCARPESKSDPGCTVLSRSDMTGANMSGADLTGVKLKQVTLVDASLVGTILTGADLYCSYLRNADLTGASLHNAVLTNTTWIDSDLNGVWFAGADVAGASADDNTQLDPSTSGYLRLSLGSLPTILESISDTPTIDHLAKDFTELACSDSLIGGGMLRWVIDAKRLYADKGDQTRKRAAEVIAESFRVAIVDHGEALDQEEAGLKITKERCAGLYDLKLARAQREALGLGGSAD